ncbi:MAG: radical SAM family heme chaperone HemW [Desulforhopalus sp.]
MSSLYIHIPFCLSKCHYCSFSSFVASKFQYDQYIGAVKGELLQLLEREGELILDTLFIGGGTPTCLPVFQLKELLHQCFSNYQVTPEAEISIEANPGTVNENYLEELLECGVNRLSLGIQSFDDGELGALGRRHNKMQACGAVKAAQHVGFKNINLDLMYGLPEQNSASWQRSLGHGLSLGPTHLSLYQLTIESDTLFGKRVEQGDLALPGEEEVLLMDAVTADLCREGGFSRYETSNYSRDGFRCRHNINYWRNDDYYAVGAGAVSFLRGVREKRIADPARYVRLSYQKNSVVSEREQLTREESFRETVIMGLRMDEGVSREALLRRYEIDMEHYYGSTLEKLLQDGFVELTDSHLRISPKGWPLSNRIMAELV